MALLAPHLVKTLAMPLIAGRPSRNPSETTWGPCWLTPGTSITSATDLQHQPGPEGESQARRGPEASTPVRLVTMPKEIFFFFFFFFFRFFFAS